MKTKMNTQEKSVIQVLPALNQGGVERGTIEIAEACQKAGIRNYVISSGGRMVAELEKLGVEHITLPVATKNPFKLWWNSKKLGRIFKEKNAAVVHVRSRAPAWSVQWASRKTGIPYIATFHGRYGLKPEIFKKRYNRVMLEGEKVIAVSSFIQNHLMRDYGVPDQHIRLIPRGADTKKFDLARVTLADEEAFFKAHDIPADKPIITLVGRLSRIKGQLVLLDAVKQMKHKAVTILLVGGNPKGDVQNDIDKSLMELPEETSVRIFSVTGNEMPVVYAVSDVCVQPTLVPESFGRGIAEAQAMKRIVIAADHGGACELIRQDYSGFLVPVGDAKILAGYLDHVLDLPLAEKQKIGERAYESIHNNYSIEKMCNRTLALYKEFLNRK